MKPSVYLETTVVSFLTARPTRDVVMAGMIRQTRDWWESRFGEFSCYVAEPVVREASRGDADAIRRRTAFLKQFPVLPTTDNARCLAAILLSQVPLPPGAADDALHIAVAATSGMNYLLTWNYRHIANAVLRPTAEVICLQASWRCPVICTPPELS